MGSSTPLQKSADIAHLEGFVSFFGYPIKHSFSPLLHQTVYDNIGLKWSQIPFESVDTDKFLQILQNPKCHGSTVTMPHKVSIIPYLDEMTRECRDIGACNTIFFKEQDGKRKLVGTNTDHIGIRESFFRNLEGETTVGSYRGKPGLVIGGGGACRSAVYALHRWLGCSEIYIVNRDVAEVEAVISTCKQAGFGDSLIHVKTAAQAEALASPGAIVSCIPNFPPKTPEEIEARKVIEILLTKKEKGAMLEMCYHPTPYTEIGNVAEKLGWQVILGTEAMIYQGLEQDHYWTEREVETLPSEEVKVAIAKALKQHHG
jgi:quinate dehydrogenase